LAATTPSSADVRWQHRTACGSAVVRFFATKPHRVGGSGGEDFEDLPADGHLLIGFKVTLDVHGDRRIIRSLQPMFVGEHGMVEGQVQGEPIGRPRTIEAKPGYAVGAVAAVGRDRVNALQIVFMRIQGAHLDPDDFYKSEKIGEPTMLLTETLAGDGEFVVGIFGKSGADVDNLGLVLIQPGRLAPER
jgi:hypothetical protein